MRIPGLLAATIVCFDSVLAFVQIKVTRSEYRWFSIDKSIKHLLLRQIHTIPGAQDDGVIRICNQRAHLGCIGRAIRWPILSEGRVTIRAPGELPGPGCRITSLLRWNSIEEHMDMQ